MKGSKTTRQHYGNTERGKSNKRSDKPTKLDRKSSRGMIYENEELRLRTININAEVERGQSDIKRLRKENDQLRREIWSLRDEYDRLNKRFKTKFVEPDHGSYNARCSQSGCSCQCNDGSGGGCEGGHCYSEDSDSCESCCCHESEDLACNDECCSETKKLPETTEQHDQPPDESKSVSVNESVPPGPSKLPTFDHLSVVSEETLSSSDVLTPNTENLLGYNPDISGSQTTLPSLVGPLTPLTPIEMVANELNDLQAMVPPLSYFENILQQHMSTNLSTPGTSSSNSGKTVIRHTNGWDYNLQSPFSQKRYPTNSVSPTLQQRSTAQTLTTFVPTPTTTVTPPPPENPTANGKSEVPEATSSSQHNNSAIETVPITTMPVNGLVAQPTSLVNNNSSNTGSNNGNNINGNIKPKHFFAPIKPKLKLNTALANQRRIQPPPPPSPTVARTAAPTGLVTSSGNSSTTLFTNGSLGVQQQKFEPPDIYVTNALATPYKHPVKPTVQPPPIPQRITSKASTAQVSSPRQRLNSRQQQQLQQLGQGHHQQQQQQHRHHYQHQLHSSADHVADANNDACAAVATTLTPITKTSVTITTTTTATCTTTLCLLAPAILKTTTLTTALLASNILCNSSSNATLRPPVTRTVATGTPIASATASSSSSSSPSSCSLLSEHVACLPAAFASFKFFYPNINFGKPNEPVYAIAQNVCHNFIIAPAVRQPLMSSIVKCCPSTITPKKTMAITDGSVVISTPSHITVQPTITSNVSHCPNAMNSLSRCTSTTTTTPTSSTITTSKNCFIVDSVCQTDSVNLESILNDIEAISEDILAIQLEKSKSRENLQNQSTEAAAIVKNPPLQQSSKNSKPYRSEMNLLLSYDGDRSTITQAHPTADKSSTPSDSEGTSTNGATRRTRSLEREHTDSPSPHIPDPMQPFPDNRKYIGFDRLNTAAAAAATSTAPRVAVTATQTSPIINTPVGNRPHLPLSPLVTNVNNSIQTNGKPLPPTPPARSFPSPLNIKCAGVQRSSSVTSKPSTNQSPMGSPVLGGVHPNKSQLFSTIANAAAKRAQFRSQPTHLTRSLDTDCLVDATANDTSLQNVQEEKEAIENAKRKARRVSIVCADTDSPSTPDKPMPSIRTQHTENSTTASCSDLPTVMPNPALRNLKQTSYSTPNSPHSSRKLEGGNSPTNQQTPPIISITPTSPPHQHGRASHGSNGSQHHHSHSNSYPNAVTTIQQQRKNSQDTIKASAAEIACAAANAVRSKCSRRHSEGTVSHTNQRSSGTSGGTNGGHHHAHHNHHHHQHSSSLVSNANPHHSHHSHQDSNHETVASYSDRNSNSLASSRESSASFSIRSARRKLSVSSNTGGKIPWCGCWGNGCL